jgi:hypothetical protein
LYQGVSLTDQQVHEQRGRPFDLQLRSFCHFRHQSTSDDRRKFVLMLGNVPHRLCEHLTGMLGDDNGHLDDSFFAASGGLNHD